MIGEALRLIRVFHDLKQFEVAERIGLSKSHISEIEKGHKIPSLDVLGRYAESFSIPVSQIMFFAEQVPNAKRGDRVKRNIASKVLNILRFVEMKSM